MSKKKKRADYDSPWKEILEAYFQQSFYNFSFLIQQQTQKDSKQRKYWKFSLIRRLYDKGLDEQDIRNLYKKD
ncbi:hypothetical protein NIES2101_27150 [Calothrix sp. HK-06]|nr:hypothetical protein NIES2101_27150 [Calothrix sp. HK-06]